MKDVLAGLTVAAIAIPEQMATARLGHFPPQTGLLAFVAASLGFAAFGASRTVSVGADSTITPIFAAGLALGAAAAGAQSLETAAVLAMMVGAVVAVAGFCRMGWVSSLLSAPVTCGFLAGISVHIISSQLPVFLGMAPMAGDVLSRLTGVGRSLTHANGFSILLGCAVLVLIGTTEKLDRRWPGALIGVAAATACTVAFSLQRHGVQVLGAIPPSLPHFVRTWPTLARLGQLAPLAALLAFVVMVQTAATSRSLPQEGDRARTINRDFIGVGVANIVSGLAGAFPVNASPPRSAVAADAGARSKATGLYAAASVALIAAFGMRFLAFVPSAALAAILLFIALRIVQLDVALQIWRASKPEFVLVVATALAILLLPIEAGVAVGVVLSLLHGIWTITRARVTALERIRGTSIWWPPGLDTPPEKTKDVLVLAFQAPLSFLNAETFRRGAMDLVTRARTPPRLVVLEASSIVEIDFTAAHALAELVDFCRDRGIVFAVARLESVRAQNSFRRFGLTETVGNEHFYRSVYQAVEALIPAEAPI
jgi:MFS superfamily sulfate permease-like transporter